MPRSAPLRRAATLQVVAAGESPDPEGGDRQGNCPPIAARSTWETASRRSPLVLIGGPSCGSRRRFLRGYAAGACRTSSGAAGWLRRPVTGSATPRVRPSRPSCLWWRPKLLTRSDPQPETIGWALAMLLLYLITMPARRVDVRLARSPWLTSGRLRRGGAARITRSLRSPAARATASLPLPGRARLRVCGRRPPEPGPQGTSAPAPHPEHPARSPGPRSARGPGPRVTS